VLEAWVSAGHPLGTHQWSHADLNDGAVSSFLDGVARNEPLLRALQPSASESTWRVFRYPFLHEGNTLADRDAVRAHLKTAGYRVAQVTVDPYDWAYDAVYARCLAKGDAGGAAALRTQFLAEARAKLRWSVAVGRALEGRPVRHVLLLHLGHLDADAVDQLLSDYERLGVRWVTLAHAQEDAIYARNPNVLEGGAYLFQLAEMQGVVLPPAPASPSALIDVLCK
jgi:peptidoglycan-N-acetylglucosamine deacetylase